MNQSGFSHVFLPYPTYPSLCSAGNVLAVIGGYHRCGGAQLIQPFITPVIVPPDCDHVPGPRFRELCDLPLYKMSNALNSTLWLHCHPDGFSAKDCWISTMQPWWDRVVGVHHQGAKQHFFYPILLLILNPNVPSWKCKHPHKMKKSKIQNDCNCVFFNPPTVHICCFPRVLLFKLLHIH